MNLEGPSFVWAIFWVSDWAKSSTEMLLNVGHFQKTIKAIVSNLGATSE